MCSSDLTDGLVEAPNEQGAMFGAEQMLSFVHECRDAAANEIISKIHQQVISFCQGRPQEDDLTVVLMKYLPNLVHA